MQRTYQGLTVAILANTGSCIAKALVLIPPMRSFLKMSESLSPSGHGSLDGDSLGANSLHIAPDIVEFENLLSCLRKGYADLWSHCDRITHDNLRLRSCLSERPSYEEATTRSFALSPSSHVENPACNEVGSLQVENPA